MVRCFLSETSQDRGKKSLEGFFCLIALLGAGWVNPCATAYFQDLGLGVRPAGLGDAFTAVADDSNTLAYNPAGLGNLQKRELNAMYSDLYSNLNARLYTGQNDSLGFHNLALAFPFGPALGGFGAYWSLFQSQFYRENSFVLGYGREIGAELWKAFHASERLQNYRLCVGMNMKFLNWMAVGNDYTDTLSKTGFTADAGCWFSTPDKISFGLTVQNFIPANVGETVTENIPLIFRTGLAYEYAMNSEIVTSLLGALDYVYRDSISDLRGGVEGWFFKHLVGLRAGSNLDQFTAGMSVFAPLNNSNMDLRFDYAFAYPYQIQSTWGSHRFSLIVRWGGAKQPGVAASAGNSPAPIALEPEVNLAAKREKELAEERARDEAKLKTVMDQLRAQIRETQSELERLSELVRLGQLPSIQFKTGKAVLTRQSYPTLDQMGRVLQKHLDIKARLEGHTDSTGKLKANMKLSQARVDVVREYLVSHYNLRPLNLISIGYGPTRPVANNHTEAGRAANRRVEIKVLIPSGLEMNSPEAGQAAAVTPTASGQISPEDIVHYEDVEKLRDKLKVYEMQVNPEEVEKIFNQQHQKDESVPPKSGSDLPAAPPAAAPSKP